MASYSGTVLSAPIVVGTDLDKFPTHKSEFGKGGWREVADTTERDAIPAERRTAGMAVYVKSDSKVYILDANITSWTEFKQGKVTSVNNTAPDASGNVSIAIPDAANDSTITLTQGGVTKGTFTLNAANGKTIELDPGAAPITYDAEKQALNLTGNAPSGGSIAGLSVDDTLGNNALEFTDGDDNIAMLVDNEGNLKTYAFDSTQVVSTETTDLMQDEINLSDSDFGVELTMATTKNLYLEDDSIVCKCKVNSLSGQTLKIFTAVGSGVARGSGCFVNFETGLIGFYAGLAGTSSQTVKYSRQSTLTFVAGHEYQVEMRKEMKHHILKITDAYTLQEDVYDVFPTGSSDIGEHWGKRSYQATSNITVESFKDYSLEPYNCQLLIIGDSFIEGATGFLDNYKNRYCIRMKRLLMGSCNINGFGGATTSQCRAIYNDYAKTACKPKYVLLACGTNDTNYSTWLTQIQGFIADVKAQNSIPILVTITRRMDNDNLNFIRQTNNWIRNTSGELYFDFNIITTLNFDGETQNTALFASDKVHPLPATHVLMTKRAMIDVPEVFNLAENYVKNRQAVGGV